MLAVGVAVGCGTKGTTAAAPIQPVVPVAPSGVQPCSTGTFTYTNTVKTAPVGIVAQGDTNWLDKGAGLPANTLTSLTNFAPGTFKQIGIYAFWSQLINSQGNFDFSAIDTALCSLLAYNITAKDNVTAKLRIVPTSRQISVVTGNTVTASPPAALAQGGLPNGTYIIYQPQNANYKNISVGAYYLPSYTAMWKSLNDALAARYDANTLISIMSVETCASVDLEPWIQANDTISSAHLALFSPAYTDNAVLNCLDNAPDAYSSWTLTPLMDVFGSYNCLGDNTNPNCGTSTKVQYTDTIATMSRYSANFGARFAYESNGLRPSSSADGEQTFPLPTPGVNGGPPNHWAEMGANASPVSFQPLDPNIPFADLQSATSDGLLYCMTQLELNSQAQLGSGGSTPKVTQANLATLQAILNAGPPNGLNWNGVACKNK